MCQVYHDVWKQEDYILKNDGSAYEFYIPARWIAYPTLRTKDSNFYILTLEECPSPISMGLTRKWICLGSGGVPFLLCFNSFLRSTISERHLSLPVIIPSWDSLSKCTALLYQTNCPLQHPVSHLESTRATAGRAQWQKDLPAAVPQKWVFRGTLALNMEVPFIHYSK